MTKLRWILGALGAAALAVPAAASAQDWDQEYESEPDVQIETDEGTEITVEGNGEADDFYAERERAREEASKPDRGVEVQAQGGIVGFPGELASQLSPGALYGVTVGIEPGIPVLELELGYMGAAYQTDERLTGAQENAIENGGQALLMASPKFGAWEPYVFGGYQLSRFNVYERDNSTGALEDDTINKAPVGAGLDIHLGDVLVGARGSYNFVFDDDAFTNLNDEDNVDQITGSLLVGGQV